MISSSVRDRLQFGPGRGHRVSEATASAIGFRSTEDNVSYCGITAQIVKSATMQNDPHIIDNTPHYWKNSTFWQKPHIMIDLFYDHYHDIITMHNHDSPHFDNPPTFWLFSRSFPHIRIQNPVLYPTTVPTFYLIAPTYRFLHILMDYVQSQILPDPPHIPHFVCTSAVTIHYNKFHYLQICGLFGDWTTKMWGHWEIGLSSCGE